MDRLIFHVDVNSAFLSWEAARLVAQGGEDIRKIPSCISGDPTKRTSVVLAKSIPAKKYNIKTGEPVSMALRKCPELYIVKPDFELYKKCSKAFKDICRAYAPVVEEYSIDECFLDMSGTELIYPDPIAAAYEIKDTIRDTLGFTVNVGIGSNKLLAKMASDFEKPDKVHTLFDYEIEKKLWPLPVGDLLMVGSAAAHRLDRAGIKTIGDLANLSKEIAKSLLGKKNGELLHKYANGISDSPVRADKDAPKSFDISITLTKNVVTADEAHKALLGLADKVAARMRRANMRAHCVCVKLRTSEFKQYSHQQMFSDATDLTSEIFEASVHLFNNLWDGATPIRLLGISLSKLVSCEAEQLSLFTDERREKNKRLDRTVDAIRDKFGKNALIRGGTLDTRGK